MEITLDGDIRRVSKLLIDGVDSKKATNVVYSSLDKERPPHSITYKHLKTIPEMVKLRLLSVIETNKHFHPSSTTIINEYPYYKVTYFLNGLKELQSADKQNIKMSTNDDKILSWRKLKINTSQGTLQFGKSKPLEIEPGIQEFKFLVYLMRNRRIVSYLELAKYLEVKGYHENCTNADVARDLNFALRDLKIVLSECGIPDDFVDSMIVNKYKEGYKLATE